MSDSDVFPSILDEDWDSMRRSMLAKLMGTSMDEDSIADVLIAPVIEAAGNEDSPGPAEFHGVPGEIHERRILLRQSTCSHRKHDLDGFLECMADTRPIFDEAFPP